MSIYVDGPCSSYVIWGEELPLTSITEWNPLISVPQNRSQLHSWGMGLPGPAEARQIQVAVGLQAALFFQAEMISELDEAVGLAYDYSGDDNANY
jgi:hypothetical protein